MPPHVRSQRGKIYVLCINGDDGSVMRGVRPGKALANLEEALRSKFGNLDNRVIDYFNVVVGIGVESVFIVMLFTTFDGTCLFFCPDDTCCFFVDHDKHLFQKMFTFSLSTMSSHGFLYRVFQSDDNGGRIATRDGGHGEGNE